MLQRVLSLVVLLFTALSLVFAHAAPSSPQALVVTDTKFYSDATLTVLVGEKVLDQCSGDVETWGVQTVYKTQTRVYCHPY